MSEPSDFPVDVAGAVTRVALPENALAELAIEATRARLTALAASAAGGELRLDFARVTWLGSSGLGLLMAVYRKVKDAGGHLVLYNLAPDVLELFRLTRLDTVLDIRATPEGT